MSKNSEIEAAAKLLAASKEYRVIKAIMPPEYLGNETRDVVCVLADCEATSRDPLTAHPIELGMLKIGFNHNEPGSLIVMDCLEMLNDPGVPSEPGAEAVHGISQEELNGQKFDLQKINEFLSGVHYVIAHNAAYDRPVLSRAIPELAGFRWLCSMKDVDWASLGISSRALDYLIYKAGYFHEAHRALADCIALNAVLSHPFLDGIAPLFAMCEAGEDIAWTILCTGAPFDAKDIMKQRGYRWNPGDATGDIPIKCWMTPELIGKQAMLDEFLWLQANVYRNQESATVVVIPMDSNIRYSERAKKSAYVAKSTVGIARAIAKLEAELAVMA